MMRASVRRRTAAAWRLRQVAVAALLVLPSTSCGRHAGEAHDAAVRDTQPAADTIGPLTGPRPETAGEERLPTLEVVEVWAVDDWRPQPRASCGSAGDDAGIPRESGTVHVFFGCAGPDGRHAAAVPVRAVTVPPGADPREAAVRALIAGPTPEERRAGFTSALESVDGGAAFTVRVDADTATLDFASAGLADPRQMAGRAAVAQIVAALGQFRPIRFVRVRVDGEPLCRTMGEC